jgi:hypothetical protein
VVKRSIRILEKKGPRKDSPLQKFVKKFTLLPFPQEEKLAVTLRF